MNDGTERAPKRLNFAAHLLALNAGREDKTAYLDDTRALTYGALGDQVRRCAGALIASGFRREERVLLLMHDSIDWPVAFLGCLYAGVVPVAVNTLLGSADYAWMLRHSDARGALVSQGLLPTLRESDVTVDTLVVSNMEGAQDGAIAFDAWVAGGSSETLAADTDADEVAFWLYSSGSTGRPKGTVHTHGNLYATQATYGRTVLCLTEDDVTFSAAKLFFAYGLGNALTFPLSVGATVLLMAERPTPDAIFQRLSERQLTVFFGVPTLYASMLVSPGLPARDAVALRQCISAGEPLPRDIGERFTTHFGVPVLDGIGSTEMLHIFLSNRTDDLRYGTSGKPVPGYELKLLDDAGRPVANGEVGDLFVKGDSHALMYWCNREKTCETFLGSWTRTGDKYTCDADGYWTYAGRSDDMLKISGQYVSPFEVESCLMQHRAVLEAALVGIPNSEGLTRSKAFVVLRPGREPSEELASVLKDHVKTCLAPHKYPRQIEFIAELPKTPTGKIQRFRLREREGMRE